MKETNEIIHNKENKDLIIQKVEEFWVSKLKKNDISFNSKNLIPPFEKESDPQNLSYSLSSNYMNEKNRKIKQNKDVINSNSFNNNNKKKNNHNKEKKNNNSLYNGKGFNKYKVNDNSPNNNVNNKDSNKFEKIQKVEDLRKLNLYKLYLKNNIKKESNINKCEHCGRNISDRSFYQHIIKLHLNQLDSYSQAAYCLINLEKMKKLIITIIDYSKKCHDKSDNNLIEQEWYEDFCKNIEKLKNILLKLNF